MNIPLKNIQVTLLYTIGLNADSRPVGNSPKQLWASKKDFNWSYRASKHYGTFLLNKFSLKNVVECF